MYIDAKSHGFLDSSSGSSSSSSSSLSSSSVQILPHPGLPHPGFPLLISNNEYDCSCRGWTSTELDAHSCKPAAYVNHCNEDIKGTSVGVAAAGFLQHYNR